MRKDRAGATARHKRAAVVVAEAGNAHAAVEVEAEASAAAVVAAAPGLKCAASLPNQGSLRPRACLLSSAASFDGRRHRHGPSSETSRGSPHQNSGACRRPRRAAQRLRGGSSRARIARPSLSSGGRRPACVALTARGGPDCAGDTSMCRPTSSPRILSGAIITVGRRVAWCSTATSAVTYTPNGITRACATSRRIDRRAQTTARRARTSAPRFQSHSECAVYFVVLTSCTRRFSAANGWAAFLSCSLP